MTAYAVTARISRVRPRLVAPADGGWRVAVGSRTGDAGEAPTIVLTQPDDALPASGGRS